MTGQGPYPGPIAPENNPVIMPQYYNPSRFVISGITLGSTTTITTSVPHNYVIGQLVRVNVPHAYGSYQLNEMLGYVTSIPSSDQVVTTINSILSNPFIPSPAYGPTLPEILAVGDINFGTISSQGRSNVGTAIPGSFINVSPS